MEEDNIHNSRIVKCGELVKNYPEYSTILKGLTNNCVQGKETVTFSKEDWDNALVIIKQVEDKVTEISKLTPVTQAHGLCKATVCQLDVVGAMRDKANKDAGKVKMLYKVVDYVLGIVDNLIREEVIAANDWWVIKAGDIRSKIDDMKRA